MPLSEVANPLLLAPLALWWALVFVGHAMWPWYALHAWIVGALLHACVPSRTDWKVALPALVAIGVMVAALAIWYFVTK